MAKSTDTTPTAAPKKDSAKPRYDFGEVSEATHHSMQGNKRRDTKPEFIVRHMLREFGWTGYRLDWKKCKGHPDIAYPGRKIAIFVNGCFWHHHEGCKYATTPKKNVEYWQAKFTRNKERDRETRAELESRGWKVVVIWECELKKDQIEATRTRLHDELEYAFMEI
jgi:DNA mismatch endonuclease (patch repair protein)